MASTAQGYYYPLGSIPFPFPPQDFPSWSSNSYWPPTPDLYFPNPSSPALPSSPAGSSSASSSSSSGISRTSILTPAIVASVALLGSAILLISYYRVFAKYCSAWQLFWGLTSSSSDRRGGHRGAHNAIGSSTADLEQGWLLSMNTGLDESIVKRIPVHVFRVGEEELVGSSECAVCLGEFEELEELRILPKCSHAFHLACIDMWLRYHSNCPLCRAPIAALALPAPPQEQAENMPENIPPENVPPPLQNMLPHAEVFALEIVESEGADDSRRGERNAAATIEQEQGNLALKRSLSLQIDDDHPHYNQQRRNWRAGDLAGPVVLRRSHSTGSNPLNYQDLLMAYSAGNSIIIDNSAAPAAIGSSASSSASSTSSSSSSSESNGLVLLSSNLAAQLHKIKNLDDEADDDESEYVVLNIELASAGANYEQISGDKDNSSSSIVVVNHNNDASSIRKSGSFKASLKRSFSAGRVFSFRSFGRSRSHTSFST